MSTPKNETEKNHQSLVKYFDDLVSATNPPSLPPALAENKQLVQCHEKALIIRQTISDFSRGDLSTKISTRGFLAGCCKALQAHLRHLTWQVKQIESGDYSRGWSF